MIHVIQYHDPNHAPINIHYFVSLIYDLSGCLIPWRQIRTTVTSKPGRLRSFSEDAPTQNVGRSQHRFANWQEIELRINYKQAICSFQELVVIRDLRMILIW